VQDSADLHKLADDLKHMCKLATPQDVANAMLAAITLITNSTG
jgi:hypothetical protein